MAAAGLQAVAGQRLNHGFFQRPQVPVNVGPEIFEVEQRVGHQLAGAVKRDVAPPD
jgi:hypothetical protein